jgi:amidase
VTITEGQLNELTVDAFHDALRNRELTAVELVAWYLARIQAHDREGIELRSVVTVNPRAFEEAAATDSFLASSGKLRGALHGVPVLVKDQAETAGLRTTFGSILFENYVPTADATVVTKLKEAGAVVLAKTSMCDFAAGWFSSSSMTAHTRNPYDVTREAGGSSAGTAAGVAANLGLIGIGEDTGGSIRIPASFTNLFGLRVTTGLISRRGFSPLIHFQDTPGPIARTVADIATLLDSIVGYDPEDPFTVTASADGVGGYARALEALVPLSDWRVGVLEDGFGSDRNPDAAPVNRVVRAAISRLQSLGVSVTAGVEIAELPAWIDRTSLYGLQSGTDITAFLADRPDAPVASFDEIYQSSRFHPLNDLFHEIATGPDTLDEDVGYLRGRLDQEHFRRLILNVFASQRLDFLIYPTVQVVPPTHEELASAKYTARSFPTNTVIASQAGLPALTIPVGFTEDGLPVGLELLGAPLSEAKMMQFGKGWESAAKPRAAPVL